MEEVEIITLAPSDWQSYRNIRLRALKEEPQAFLTRYQDAFNEPLENWKQRLEDAEEGKIEWISFAKLANELIGMAAAFSEEGSDTATIVSVFVAKEARGKGISKKLMNHLISNIQRRGHIKTLNIEVKPSQTIAYNLYRSLGFVEHSTIEHVKTDGTHHDDIQMKKSL